MQDLANGHLDVKALGEAANGDENTIVTTRTGNTYPSAERAINIMFQNGGLPAKPFATKAKMITDGASLPDDSYAMVTNEKGVDAINNGLYVKTAGAWVKSGYDPVDLAKVYVNEKLYNTPDNGNVFEFVDSNGLVGVTIDNNGNINASNINSINGFNDAAMVVTDKHGNVALMVDAAGNLQSSTIIKLDQRVAAIEGSSIKPVPITPNKKTDYMHVFSYGQSLSRGYRSTPVISTTQPYSNLTFASGVLPRLADVHDFTNFKPLVEEVSGIEGESPVSGMLNGFVASQVAKGDEASNWAMIGSAPGRAGYSIAQLSKGLAEYTGMIAQVQAAYDIAQSQNSSYSVWCITWSQGEQDYSLNTPEAAYTNSLLKLRDDFNADVKAITGQLFSPIFIMYQVATHRRYSRNEMTIALAQLKLANNDPNFIMACPIYNLPHYTDNLHLTSDSSLQLGKYYAKALDYTINEGEKWQPLKPISITRQGKVIDIEFNKSGLTIDTVLVTATHNMGFDLWSDGLLLDTITTVTVSDKNRVRLVLSSTPPDGIKISYGKGRVGDPLTGGNITGARGNLRDSAGDSDNYVDSKGVTRYMHNFCVMFEQSI